MKIKQNENHTTPIGMEGKENDKGILHLPETNVGAEMRPLLWMLVQILFLFPLHVFLTTKSSSKWERKSYFMIEFNGT